MLFCFGVFSPTNLATSCSSGLGQTEVLALLLRLEAVLVAATAAVPEAGALALLVVVEPHHGVVLAAAGVLAEDTGVWTEAGERGHSGAGNIGRPFDITCHRIVYC